MDIWGFLNFLESAETNRRLEEIQEENQWHRESMAQDKLHNTLKYFLQELYRKSGNVSSLNLSRVSQIEGRMRANYNNIYYRKKPEKSILVFIALFVVSVLIIIAGAFNASFIMGILFFALGYVIYRMYAQREAVYAYDGNIRDKQSSLKELRSTFPGLTSLGLYYKHYLDSHTEEVMSLLKQEDGYRAYQARKALYELFDMDSGYDIDIELYMLNSWNHELMKQYDKMTAQNKGSDNSLGYHLLKGLEGAKI